jgi:hypothetical protein
MAGLVDSMWSTAQPVLQVGRMAQQEGILKYFSITPWSKAWVSRSFLERRCPADMLRPSAF